MSTVKISGRAVGLNQRPYLIAEMSGNHNGSLERALQIVEGAARAGADAVKIQTYTADTMTIDSREPGFVIEDERSLWQGRTLYDLYEEAHMPWEWHEPIFDLASKRGIAAFSSPFDESAVEFLERLKVPAYKIASFENVDLPLIRRVAETGKPVIISTGMASVAEIGEAVETARGAGCHQLLLMKCTSNYPADPEDSNMRTIPHLRELFGCEVGISDHTPGVGVALAGVALGASAIEKHVTIDRDDGGVDAEFSLNLDELKVLREESERAWRSLGAVAYGPSKDERRSLQFRRSLYVVEGVRRGEPLTRENVRAIRPGLGMQPKLYGLILGRRAARDIKRGTPLSWDLIE
jgi:N-acetylneuraminate synthase